jgi:hypothetical protein
VASVPHLANATAVAVATSPSSTLRRDSAGVVVLARERAVVTRVTLVTSGTS